MERLAVQPQLVDRVYAAILDAICAGRLTPGERITQDGLAETLAVSRQPVLQALLLLKKQGFVRDTGRRGLVVAPLDPAFVRHVYQVRAALDGTAARGAAERRVADAATRGAALIETGRRTAKGGDVGAMIAADIEFHRFLYELSGNPLIAEAAALHWQHIRRVMGGVLQSDGGARIWDEHAAILDAVVAGKADDAERRARAHADAASHRLAEQLAGLAVADTKQYA